jgi:hypothetical protein
MMVSIHGKIDSGINDTLVQNQNFLPLSLGDFELIFRALRWPFNEFTNG